MGLPLIPALLWGWDGVWGHFWGRAPHPQDTQPPQSSRPGFIAAGWPQTKNNRGEQSSQMREREKFRCVFIPTRFNYP